MKTLIAVLLFSISVQVAIAKDVYEVSSQFPIEFRKLFHEVQAESFFELNKEVLKNIDFLSTKIEKTDTLSIVKSVFYKSLLDRYQEQKVRRDTILSLTSRGINEQNDKVSNKQFLSHWIASKALAELSDVTEMNETRSLVRLAEEGKAFAVELKSSFWAEKRLSLLIYQELRDSEKNRFGQSLAQDYPILINDTKQALSSFYLYTQKLSSYQIKNHVWTHIQLAGAKPKKPKKDPIKEVKIPEVKKEEVKEKWVPKDPDEKLPDPVQHWF